MDEKAEADPLQEQHTNELKNIIEAAILYSEEPLTIDRMLTMFTKDTRPERAAIKDIILALEEDYVARGYELKRIDKGYRLQTREEYAPWLSRLSAGRAPRYSRAMLETLAIIAYRQPVTRGEIEEIRGVAVSTDIIRTLLEREWVRQVGVRDVPGKPALFATTKMFLEYFNLQSLSQLPPLMEIRDMDTIAAELNMTLPLEGGSEVGDQDEPAANDDSHTVPAGDHDYADVDASTELPDSAQDVQEAQEEKSADEESAARSPGDDDRDS
jgi:segregation and condensation protein B